MTPASEGEYGAHWWLLPATSPQDPHPFSASGYRGQYIFVLPDRDLVLVRLGNSDPEQREVLIPILMEIVGAFPRYS